MLKSIAIVIDFLPVHPLYFSAASHALTSKSDPKMTVKEPGKLTRPQHLPDNSSLLAGQINEALIKEYAPTAFFVNENMELVHVTGNAAGYLNLQKTRSTSNILELLPGALVPLIEAGSMDVLSQGRSSVMRNIKFMMNGRMRTIHLEMDIFNVRGIQSRLVRIRMDEIGEEPAYSKDARGRAGHEKLADELQMNRDNLKITMGALEAAVKELKAVNEELQSVNGELLLSKKELKVAHQRQTKIEELYDTICRNTRDLIGLHDPAGAFCYVSPSVTELLGYEPHELIGVSLYDLVYPADRQKLEQEQVRIAGGKLEQQTEYRIRKKDGSYLWLEASSRFITDETGMIVKWLTCSRDIAFRKQAELSIRASEERYRTLFDNNPFPMFVLDPVTLGFLQVNTAAVRVYGYSTEEFSSMKLDELLHERSNDSHNSCELITSGHWLHKAKNGKAVTVELSSTPISFDHGKAVLVLVNDVSERAELEEEVAERTRELLLSEGRFRVLAESIPQIIWTASPEGVIDYYNERWYNFTGVKHGDIIDQKWWKQVVHPQDAKPTLDAWKHSVATGEEFSIECRLKGKWAGVYRWYLGKALPLRDSDGSIVKWFGTFTNIDDQKQLEERKDEFIGIASHELKTPLTSIKAYTELLERRLMDGSDETSRIYITKTNGYIKKLGQLISDLLDVSKIQAGKLQFHMQDFDADEFVKESIDNIMHLANKHRITINGKAGVQLRGDKQRLEQVLSNLLSNAMKYSPAADEVIVNVCHDDEKVTISVTDHGIGVPADKHTKLFERFYRVEKNAYRFQGLGIGLYISAEIVRRHGGKIWVESEEGKGATFHFTLPLPGTQQEVQAYLTSGL